MKDTIKLKLAQCPNCKQKSYRITCTDRTSTATRRRYVCDLCKFKESKYELDEETYEKWKRYEYVLGKIKELVTYLKFKY
jgi:protein-arginine kinase activator protein McsA